jgi:penicillin amidase
MNLPKLVFELLLGRRLPIIAGRLGVPGIHGPIAIRRDRYGIPHIEAEGDDDAWYGLGFCQGQDRAFQLETLLRAVRGTLAELVGAESLPVDRLSRRIGFYRAAQAQLDALDGEIRSMLEAYVRGVNDGTTVGCRRKAHEFVLLRARPTPFTAADVLGMVKLMCFTLASNWDCELARFKMLTADGPEALMALDPTYPVWLPVTSPPGARAGGAVDRLAEDVALFRAAVGQGGGSNNWAIAPSRTVTGRPLVANDPHLPPSLPPHWYLAHLRTPEWSVAGASFVGGPAFPAGHNGTAAWGNTAGLFDDTDLFIEEIGSDGRSVRQGDEFIPCEVRQEVIQIKGEDPFEEEVLITPRGPIIGPALEGEARTVSLRAVWLDPRPARGLFQIHRARTFEEFRRAFEEWPGLPLNMVYADTSGTIGWQLVGEAPQRRKGWGTIPLPGWDPEVGWEEEPIPFEDMPHLDDPEAGFVATANNQPAAEGECPFLGVDWVDGYRLCRIVETLEARHDWDLKRAQALQMDEMSLAWRELRYAVLALPGENAEVRQAQALLQAWDGVLSVSSAAATVFEFFVAEMTQRIVQAKAPRAGQWALGQGFAFLAPQSMFYGRRVSHLVRMARDQPEGWFERPWPEEMADALRIVVRALRERYGQSPEQWSWGHIRPLTLRHTVGERPPLAQVFNLGPFAWGGDVNTVGQASGVPGDPVANPSMIASLRMVVDVGEWDASRFVLPGGQSGNPLSPHYDDLLPYWRRGEGVPIAWSDQEVERAARSVLRLVPK